MIRAIKYLLRRLFSLCYRMEVTGLENYHKAGKRTLIIANHTSLLDVVLIYAWLPEMPTFAINAEIATRRTFKPFFRFVKLFEVDPLRPLLIKSIIEYLRQDNKVIIFPEGRITTTGSLMKIYEGTGLIADKSDAVILPIVLEGAQYTPFSYMRHKGHIRWFPKITMKIMPPRKIHLPADLHGNERRRAAAMYIKNLMYEMVYTAFDQRKTLYTALLESARQFGKKHVVIKDINGSRLSYRSLILRSIVLGDVIKKQTEKGEYAGVLLPNVSALPVLFFALQFTGRVPVMLNYTVGLLTLKRACDTVRLKIIYTSRTFIEKAKLESIVEEIEREYRIVYLEDIGKEIGLFDKLAAWRKSRNALKYHIGQNIDTNPDGTAVILFTSGSEGYPKAVLLSHRNLLANYAQVRCHIHFSRTDIVFCCLPLFHSFGLNAGFLMPTLSGGQTFLYPTPLHYQIIPELIYQLQATVLLGTNTFLKGYAHHAHPFDFSSLKYIVAGAEKLHRDTMQLYMEKFGQRILQGYGVTETSPVISVNNPITNKSGTVGHIMPGMEYYIKPVEGIENGGHLVVSGANVMQGYLLHEKPGELQAPATERGEGWYDTSDIVSVDDEGFITIQGRAKRFAKVGGEMVSLALTEELATSTWPQINHAALAVYDERKGEKIILITEKTDAMRKPLQEKAKQLKMTELAVPRSIQLMEKIPLLNTGKIDYVALHKTVMEDHEQPD